MTRGETIDVETRDGTADAYLVRPAGGDRAPSVLLVPDAFGLRAQIEQMADRIAGAGFTVLAPNVFYRDGRAPVVAMPDLEDPAQRAPFMERLRPVMAALTSDLVVRDGAAYLEVLEREGRGPVAITGYCMGGRVGWRIAAAYADRVAALAGFHAGGLVSDDEDSPHRSAGELSAELSFGHADHDHSMTPDQIAQLERALDEAGLAFRSELYEGAAHGYTMADTAAYDPTAAERHFAQLLELLRRTIARDATT